MDVKVGAIQITDRFLSAPIFRLKDKPSMTLRIPLCPADGKSEFERHVKSGRWRRSSVKKWTDKANKTHESTDWFRVAAWGNLTKFASSLKKGDPVLVQGELRTGEYTDEKKVTRQTVELVAQTILRIDYTKLGVAEQGDAAEPEA
jgi:hypothetical protein